jgi:hypothetical protein
MRYPAMVLKGGNGAFDAPQNVQVSGFSSQHHSHGSARRLAIETGAPHARSG